MVELQDVAVRFDGRPVFEHVSVHIPPGVHAAVMGPSGVGKTTLLRLIAGLLKPDAGRVRVHTPRRAMLFQSPRLLPWLNALENVNTVLSDGSRTLPEAMSWLQRVGLGAAAGKYPVEAVRTMARIAETTEKNIDYTRLFRTSDFIIHSEMDAISHATCGMAIDLQAKGIVACTLSGMTARMVSRFRSPVDIIGLTTEEKTWRSLALSWGVTPKLAEYFPSTEVLFFSAKKVAIETLNLEKGDKVVITGGITNGQSGNTNLIKIENIGDKR